MIQDHDMSEKMSEHTCAKVSCGCEWRYVGRVMEERTALI